MLGGSLMMVSKYLMAVALFAVVNKSMGDVMPDECLDYPDLKVDMCEAQYQSNCSSGITEQYDINCGEYVILKKKKEEYPKLVAISEAKLSSTSGQEFEDWLYFASKFPKAGFSLRDFYFFEVGAELQLLFAIRYLSRSTDYVNSQENAEKLVYYSLLYSIAFAGVDSSLSSEMRHLRKELIEVVGLKKYEGIVERALLDSRHKR